MGDFHPEAHKKGFSGLSFIAFICNKSSAVLTALSLSKTMGQNYKVFVKESPLLLTNSQAAETFLPARILSRESWEQTVTDLYEGKVPHATLFVPGGQDPMEACRGFIKEVRAAGGLVFNKKGKLLMIFRNGKWDLPKGKLENGESLELGAVREVEEETAVTGVTIDEFYRTTYHIYKNKVFTLKRVDWYLMNTRYKGKLIPQQEEGITEVDWFGKKKIRKALSNTYPTIRELLDFWDVRNR